MEWVECPYCTLACGCRVRHTAPICPADKPAFGTTSKEYEAAVASLEKKS